MAKIYKVSGYLIDLNGESVEDDVKMAMRDDYSYGFITRHVKIAESEFDWDDNHPLNYHNCDITECEKYFTHT